jgi:hypothetical protein
MTSSRRDFLKKGSLVALVGGLPLGLAEKIVANETGSASGARGLSQAAFERQLNTEFLIKTGDQKIRVKLAAVDDLRRDKKSNGKECYGLRFHGDTSHRLTQDTYLIEHKELGVFSFLLVPIGMTSNRPQYEAVINHVTS